MVQQGTSSQGRFDPLQRDAFSWRASLKKEGGSRKGGGQGAGGRGAGPRCPPWFRLASARSPPPRPASHGGRVSGVSIRTFGAQEFRGERMVQATTVLSVVSITVFLPLLSDLGTNKPVKARF